MKKITLVSIISLISFVLSAQNMKFSSANYNYKKIPATIRENDENTFSVTVLSKANLSYPNTTTEQLANNFSFNNISKVDGYGDIKIYLKYVSINRGNTETLYTKKEDGTITSYQFSSPYKIAYEYRVTSKSLNLNNTGSYQTNSGREFTYTSKKFKDKSAYNDYLAKQSGNGYKSHLNGSLNQISKEIRNKISAQIEFQDLKNTAYLYYFKSNKKNDYSAYENASNACIEEFKKYTTSTDRTKKKSILEPHISSWKNNLQGLHPLDKKTKKFYFVNAYNLATAYLMLDDAENAKKYLTELQKSREKKAVQKNLAKTIDKRITGLKIAKSNAVSPYKNLPTASSDKIERLNKKFEDDREERELRKEIAVAKAKAIREAELAPVINKYSGFIINRKDEKQQGEFIRYGKNNGEKTGKTVFVKEGTTKEISFSVANFTSCEFDDKKYNTVEYFSGPEKYKDLLYIVYESSKITVYKGGPYNDIFFRKTDQKRARNTNTLLYLTAFKKACAKYFSDCPSLVSKIEAGEYPNKEAMRIAMAKDYSNSCK